MFESAAGSAYAPLAVRMRPTRVEEILGQDHVLGEGMPLRRLIDGESGRANVSSVIMWGPPGIGKTTLAYLIAQRDDRDFVEVSAVSAGVKELRDVIKQARSQLVTTGRTTVLFVDEVHRFSKTQQDALLPAVENQWVILVAATTENPSFSVISPLLSRSILITLHPLSPEDLSALVDRALTDERGFAGALTMDDDARANLLRLAGSDARRVLTLLEAAGGRALGRVTDLAGGVGLITADDVAATADSALVRYDRAGDQHYDVISAFIKSMRGSDPDAAVHYLARMLEAGEDPRFIARRIMILAAEDIGMADPQALAVATAAAQSVALVGMPEARIILAQAVIYAATAPKSNAVYLAIDAALADVRAGKSGVVPPHLRDAHYSGAEDLGHGVGYQYAHNAPDAIARQEYLPESLRGAVYYRPNSRGYEAHVANVLAKVRERLGRGSIGEL